MRRFFWFQGALALLGTAGCYTASTATGLPLVLVADVALPGKQRDSTTKTSMLRAGISSSRT